MPPIAPSQQGSRTALISSLVIFVILFVTTTILSINFYSKWDAAEKTAAEDRKKADTYFSAADKASAPVVALVGEASKQGGRTALAMAITQRDQLAKDVEAKKAEIQSLTDQVAARDTQLSQAQADVKSANDKAAAEVKAREAMLGEKTTAMKAASDNVDKLNADSKAREDAIAAATAGIQKSANDAIASANAQTASAQAETSRIQGLYKKLQDEYAKVVAALAHVRVNPNRSLLRPAGVITRVPGNNIVFINLGEGDQVMAGLTFQVYDKIKGLPPLTTINPDDKDELLPGKASIEVIRVIGPTAECRVIHVAQGQQILEGDLILNLIYNTHTKFIFNVYGDFDLAGNGQANPADAELVKRLVSQWGGKLSDQVNVDTDFLVMGKEPVVPNATENPSPLENDRREKLLKAFNDYHDLLAAAQKLNIPILNQNRFLYFVGYYDQARR